MHLNPQKNSTGIAEWKAGTPVVLIEKQDVWYLVEGKGLRGWVHEKYIVPDQPEATDAPKKEEK